MSPTTVEKREYMIHVSYASAVGSLMYAMVCTRPNLSQAVSMISRYMHDPGKDHWDAVKWVLRYIKGTQCWIGIREGFHRYAGVYQICGL